MITQPHGCLSLAVSQVMSPVITQPPGCHTQPLGCLSPSLLAVSDSALDGEDSRPWFFAVWNVVFAHFGGFCVPIGLFGLFNTRFVHG